MAPPDPGLIKARTRRPQRAGANRFGPLGAGHAAMGRTPLDSQRLVHRCPLWVPACCPRERPGPMLAAGVAAPVSHCRDTSRAQQKEKEQQKADEEELTNGSQVSVQGCELRPVPAWLAGKCSPAAGGHPRSHVRITLDFDVNGTATVPIPFMVRPHAAEEVGTSCQTADRHFDGQ